jgi:nifR3 family TIM-barrel protein
LNSTRESCLHPVDVGEFRLPNNLWFAPLAGYSHKTHRDWCRSFGAGLAVTEMVAVEGLVRGDRRTFEYLDTRGEENVSFQLFGRGDPARFAAAAKIVMERTGTRFIDVNFGCPVRKVMRSGSGSALLDRPSVMSDIVKALKDTGATVGAKVRSGIKAVNIEATIPALDAAGADLITVHPRLAVQMYTGHADWSLIALARTMTSRPLCASGDVKSPPDAERVIRETGCDAVMIGRAAIGRPWIFRECIDFFQTGRYTEPTWEEIRARLVEFARSYSFADRKPRADGRISIIPIRGELINAVRGFPGAHHLRGAIAQSETLDELEVLLKDEPVEEK